MTDSAEPTTRQTKMGNGTLHQLKCTSISCKAIKQQGYPNEETCVSCPSPQAVRYTVVRAWAKASQADAEPTTA